MSHTMTLELPSEIYEAVTRAASINGLHPAEWIVANLRQQFISPPLGSPQAILRALKDAPRVSSEDVDALEQAIKEGALPVDWTSIFEESIANLLFSKIPCEVIPEAAGDHSS